MIALSVISRHRAAGSSSRERERRRDGVRQLGPGQLAGRDVHRHPQAVGDPRVAPGSELAAGGADDPVADRDNQPGLLGRGNEGIGRDQTPLGMEPANERLDRDDTPGLEVDLGLIVEAQLIPAQRQLKLLLDREEVERARVHQGVEQLRASPAPLLGGVQREVGVAQHQLRRRGRQPVADADADAGGLLEPVSFVDERRGERGANTLGNPSRLVFACVLAEDRELVAAEARNRVLGPGRTGQPPCHLDEDGVAGQVAEPVVGQLEVVEVEEQHAELARAAPGPQERVAQAVEEQGPVGQARQGVVQRSV